MANLNNRNAAFAVNDGTVGENPFSDGVVMGRETPLVNMDPQELVIQLIEDLIRGNRFPNGYVIKVGYKEWQNNPNSFLAPQKYDPSRGDELEQLVRVGTYAVQVNKNSLGENPSAGRKLFVIKKYCTLRFWYTNAKKTTIDATRGFEINTWNGPDGSESWVPMPELWYLGGDEFANCVQVPKCARVDGKEPWDNGKSGDASFVIDMLLDNAVFHLERQS